MQTMRLVFIALFAFLAFPSNAQSTFENYSYDYAIRVFKAQFPQALDGSQWDGFIEMADGRTYQVLPDPLILDGKQTKETVTAAIEEFINPAKCKTISGMASRYGSEQHGTKTASGEKFDMYAMTAATKSLPFGTRVRVTNKRNGRSIVVRINDRGPFVQDRVIDLSRAAADAIQINGVGPVDLNCL